MKGEAAAVAAKAATGMVRTYPAGGICAHGK